MHSLPGVNNDADRINVMSGAQKIGVTTQRWNLARDDLASEICLYFEEVGDTSEEVVKIASIMNDRNGHAKAIDLLRSLAKTEKQQIIIRSVDFKFKSLVSLEEQVAAMFVRSKENPDLDVIPGDKDYLKSFSINQTTGCITLPPVDGVVDQIQNFASGLHIISSAIMNDSNKYYNSVTGRNRSERKMLVHTTVETVDNDYKKFLGLLKADLKKYENDIKALFAFFDMFYSGKDVQSIFDTYKDNTLFKQLLSLYERYLKSTIFISLKNNGIEEISKVVKDVNAWPVKYWPNIAKSRILIGMGRLVTLFFNHLYGSELCRSFITANLLEKNLKCINVLKEDFNETLLKKRWIKFNSLSKYNRVLTQKELDLWGITISISKENEIFAKVKDLYLKKDFSFYTILSDFNKSNNKKYNSDAFKKYLKSRALDFDNLVKAETNKSLRGRSPQQGKPKIDEIPLEVIDQNKKGLLDPLSRNLAMKGVYYNSRNPYFGDSLLAERSHAKGKEVFYNIPDSYINTWIEYIRTNYNNESYFGQMSNDNLKKYFDDLVDRSNKEMRKLYKA